MNKGARASFEKRRRERAKKEKRLEKLARRQRRKEQSDSGNPDDTSQDDSPEFEEPR